MSHRIVITGLGLCTPVGCGVNEFWDNLVAGRSGIGPITLFDVSGLPVGIGGEVKTLNLPLLAKQFPEVQGEKDRKVWLGLDAALRALEDADCLSTLNSHSERGRLVPASGSTSAPSAEAHSTLLSIGVSLEAFLLDSLTLPLVRDNLSAIAPLILKSSPLQTPLDRLSQILVNRYNFYRALTNCSACAAGAQAIGEAFHRLRDGRAQIALAGGTDSALHPLGVGGFGLLRILSEENDRPQQACRPFDSTRQGTVLSEGSVFLLMETLEHATARNGRIYAEIIGYGSSLDAFRVTDPEPSGRGAVLSMTAAIADAGLKPVDIYAINAHGTGTPKNDVSETLAIKQVFGSLAPWLPITANKSMTGHMIATSGAAEAAASVLSLYTSRLPPTINLHNPDAQCDLDYVPNVARDFTGQIILSNSFGFGGQNATLIFKKHAPGSPR